VSIGFIRSIIDKVEETIVRGVGGTIVVIQEIKNKLIRTVVMADRVVRSLSSRNTKILPMSQMSRFC
jgi:hypothetical protein